MSKYKKLLSNSILFAISSFGSKVLSFLLVPVYTFVLSTQQLGTADLIYATSTVLLYVFSLGIGEATMRYTMSPTTSKSAVLTNSLVVSIVMSFALLLFIPVFSLTEAFKGYAAIMCVITMLQIFYSVLTQFARGTDKVRIFAEAGICQTLFLLLSNIMLLVVFNKGVDGYLMSYVISFFLACCYTAVRIKLWRQVSFQAFDAKLLKDMLRYSCPMIVTGISWWALNASDKYVISYFLGASANGIYAVSHKIPSIVTIFAGFFLSAWQLAAIDERQNENNQQFYNQTFNYMATAAILAASAVIFGIRFLLPLVISEAYYDAVNYVPILLISGIFQTFANFYGTFNVAFKTTKNLIWNSLAAGLINLVLDIMLTPVMGMYGAALATAIGCACMWLLRVRDVSQNIGINLELKQIKLLLIFIMAQITVSFFQYTWAYIVQLLLIAVMLFVSRETIIKVVITVKRRVIRK